MAERRDIRAEQLGQPFMLGANRSTKGYIFAVQVPYGKEASLVLYRKGSEEPEREIPFQEQYRAGDICTLRLKEFQARSYEYNYRIDGRITQDPYAYGIRGRETFGSPREAGKEHELRCGFLPGYAYDWEDDAAPGLAFKDMILYKLHVRGYTKQYKLPSRKRGTFAGLAQMIPYWKELGINAIELMPAYEFMEVEPPAQQAGFISHRHEEGKVNYWGYLPGFYLAPKRAYCATREPEREVRDLVKALHRAGIECIMEMYIPEDVSPLLVMRALWFWKMYYHVDGFHLLGEGVPVNLLAGDGLLSGTKLFLDHVPERVKRMGLSASGPRFAEYDQGFLQDMRRFLKSDEDALQGAAYRTRKNQAAFGTVNFMADQNGFTLADAVSYNYKHNEANGHGNQDGSSYNYSWNCGVEGPSRKLAVRQMREQQLRNAFLMLLLSQGMPLIYGGDEFANSQDGNNNAYCQDNPVGWTDWRALKKNEDLFRFVKKAVNFRREHPILHMAEEMKGTDYKALGCPDISFHGERAWYVSYENTSRLLGIMYCGLYAEKKDGTPDDYIYVVYNFYWEKRTAALPNLPGELKWHVTADTAASAEDPFGEPDEKEYVKTIEVGPRSIVVLLGR